MNEIIELSQLARDGARTWKRWSKRAKLTTLGLALCAVFMKDIAGAMGFPNLAPTLELSIAMGSMILTLTFIGCSVASRRLHLLARDGMQRGLLLDAFGATREPLDIANLHSALSKLRRTQHPAGANPGGPYYSSDKPPGLQRFRENLQESAFFSSALFATTAKRSLVMLVVPSLFVLVISIAHPIFSGAASFSLSRCLILLFTAFITSESVAECVLLFSASHKIASVDRRLEQADLTSPEIMLCVFADYSVAAALAPTIPSGVYLSLRERLTAEWAARCETSAPVPSADVSVPIVREADHVN